MKKVTSLFCVMLFGGSLSYAMSSEIVLPPLTDDQRKELKAFLKSANIENFQGSDQSHVTVVGHNQVISSDSQFDKFIKSLPRQQEWLQPWLNGVAVLNLGQVSGKTMRCRCSSNEQWILYAHFMVGDIHR